MKLSDLQKYTLKQAWQSRDKMISKEVLERFYLGLQHPPKTRDVITIITKSVERLIRKELVIGYGYKTPHRWYIQRVKLTPKGRKIARNLFGIQQPLPFTSKKKK